MPTHVWTLLACSMLAFVPCGVAQDSFPTRARPCTQPEIDVHALPPVITSSFPAGHLVVLEIRNIGPTPCSLETPRLTLLPRLHLDDETSAHFEEHSRSSDISTLDPEQWVHLLIAWVSDAAPEVQCVALSGLKVWFRRSSISFSDDVSVELRDAVRSCSELYISDYRRGHYSTDSHVSSKWLSRISERRMDDLHLPVETRWDRLQRPSPRLRVDTFSSRTMLGDYLWFRVRFERRADHGCPYRLIRMRESTGLTVIVIAACPQGKDAADLPLSSSREQGVIRLDLRRLGLLPTHAGTVEYNMISAVGNGGRPEFAEAHLALSVHDPAPPAQAAVADPLPGCTARQLSLTALPPVISERWQTLRAYEARNTSKKPCSLAGIPLVRAVGLTSDIVYTVPLQPLACPNCPNALFAPRPNGRIDLKPEQTAHVLIGATAINTDDDPWMHCAPTPLIMLWPSTDLPPKVAEPPEAGISLNLDARICAGVDISTWRAGPFDGDQNNDRWRAERRLNDKSSHSIPPACDSAELRGLGTPHFVALRPNLSLGISAPRRSFVSGEKVSLPLLVNNTGDAPVRLWTCSDLDYFESHGFDLFDAYGHRVLDQSEMQFVEKCRTDPKGAEIGRLFVCLQNAPIAIAAHTCLTKRDRDFTVNISRRFKLPPGEYTVRFRDKPFRPRCGSSNAPSYWESSSHTTFAVVQP